jgi:hypothetical protein
MTNTVFAPISAIPIFYGSALAVGAKVYFYDAGGTTPRSIWTNKGATVAASNPVITDGNGVIPPIWVSGTADYRIVINTASNQLIRTIENLQGAASEAGVVVGGGSTYALTTGDIKWNFDTSEITGFVKLNAQTIGNAGSGAHYADDLLADLYSYLWSRISNTYAPVAGGRGANAAADFAAGKQMTLPDMRFRDFRGLSGMGNSVVAAAANWGGASAPGFTGGNDSKTIATGNLPAHTHTGTTAAGSGTIGGSTATDGSHSHTGATTDTAGTHNHSYNTPADVVINTGASASPTFKATIAAANTGDAGSHSHNVTVPTSGSTHSHALNGDPSGHTHTFTTSSVGSGTALDVIPPFAAATCYMKT